MRQASKQNGMRDAAESMERLMMVTRAAFCLVPAMLATAVPASAREAGKPAMVLNEAGYYEAPAVNVLVKPDLPENHEDWPFFWGENEYVIPEGAMWIELAHAAHELAPAS